MYHAAEELSHDCKFHPSHPCEFAGVGTNCGIENVIYENCTTSLCHWRCHGAFLLSSSENMSILGMFTHACVKKSGPSMQIHVNDDIFASQIHWDPSASETRTMHGCTILTQDAHVSSASMSNLQDSGTVGEVPKRWTGWMLKVSLRTSPSNLCCGNVLLK